MSQSSEENWDLLSDKISEDEDWSQPSGNGEASEKTVDVIPDSVCANVDIGTHNIDGEKTDLVPNEKDAESLASCSAPKTMDSCNFEKKEVESLVAESVSDSNFPDDSSSVSSKDLDVASNVGAAAAAGGFVGLILGGPVLAVIGAVGAGLASTGDNQAGDIARAGGDVAASVGDSFVDFNQKHKFVEKVRNGAENLGRKVKEVGEKQKIAEKAKASVETVKQQVKNTDGEIQLFDKIQGFFRTAADKAAAFEGKHHFVENFLMGIANGAADLAEKVKRKAAREEDNETVVVDIPRGVE